MIVRMDMYVMFLAPVVEYIKKLEMYTEYLYTFELAFCIRFRNRNGI